MNISSIPHKHLQAGMKQHEKGFILIETLVAVIILAIGLLGMASMQVAGLKNNNSAYTRTQATYLAYDIIDRIRNNPEGDYSMAMGSTPGEVGGSVALGLCDFTIATDTLNCNGGQLAAFDQASWVQDITNVLPDGKGGITVGTDDRTHTISIKWLDKEGTGTDQYVTFQMSVFI